MKKHENVIFFPDNEQKFNGLWEIFFRQGFETFISLVQGNT